MNHPTTLGTLVKIKQAEMRREAEAHRLAHLATGKPTYSARLTAIMLMIAILTGALIFFLG